MKVQIVQIPKLILQRRASAILGMIILGMLWAGIAITYRDDVQSDYRELERRNQNYAMLFEENVLRSIGEIDKALLYLRRSVEATKDTTDYQTIVMTTDVLSEIIVQVAIIDERGISRGSNAVPAPTGLIDISDREHFRVHVNSNEDKLFISKPVIGRASHKWSVQFTRRFSHKDGSFAGIVVASLNPAHFTSFYDKIDLGATTSVAMVGSDGVVRSSGGGDVPRLSLGQDISKTKLFGLVLAGSGLMIQDNGASPEDSLYVTARRVRGYPLWVMVSTRASEVYQSSWNNLQQNVLIGAFLTILVLIALEQILWAEDKAAQKADQLRLTLENMSQGIMLVTKDLQIPIINGRCAELLDLPAEFIEDPPRFDQLVEYQTRHGKPRDTDASLHPLEKPAPTSEQFAISERAMPNGTVIEVRSGHLPDGSFVQTFTDITKRCEAEAHVARLASEDPLTGLPNRRLFRSALDQISRAAADKQAEFAVLFLDLDRFKVVNDTLGHRIGDRLLQEVGARLRRSLPESDILARLGGDEFAIVVPSMQSRAALEALANHLVETVAQPYEIEGYRICSSVSVGIAVAPHDGNSAEDLLMAADLALYAVKAGSRGTHKFYHSSMNRELNDRRQIEMDLREAIACNELQLHYQPIISLRRNVVTGFEALARWRHPVKGMVPPAVFIPVAEDSGLILPLGEWALREACRSAVLWPEGLKVAVNLSPVQFSAPNLIAVVERALSESGLAPERLELEITERVFMENSEKTLSTLRGLKSLGVRISMDDFGTGYSSLSYLRSFPFDKIKIDRSFISDLSESTDHVVIVQAVVSIARALGMKTTAEGVETLDQHQFLAALGCDEAQGYLFSGPVHVDRIPELLGKWESERTMAA